MELTKLSISPANTFKLCPKKFFLQYVEGYDTSSRPPWLHLGDAYDKALEAYDTGGIEKAFEVADSLLEGNDLLNFKFIFQYYYITYAEANSFPPVDGGNQQGFGIPAYEGADWKITGYIDKVSRKEIDGQDCHIIVERKTTTDPIEQNSVYWQKLDLDPQIRSYVWYLKQKGFRAGWVCYEVVRKINTALVSGLDKSLSGQAYWDHLVAWYHRLGYKKTVVSNKMFFVTEDMCNEFVEEMTMVRGMILETEKASNMMKDAGFNPESAWVKHEQSCTSYGGCAFLPYCKKEIALDNPVYSRNHKVLK